MRLFMISKYHLLMCLTGQQSGSPANLTEPELPVTIPKCPAIHFHFLASLASHCTFSDFLLELFDFFCTAIMERKMLLADGVQSPKRRCSRTLSSRTILVVYRGENISSVLDAVPRHRRGHGVPWPSSPGKNLQWHGWMCSHNLLVWSQQLAFLPFLHFFHPLWALPFQTGTDRKSVV